jgi:ribonuclease HI
MERMVNNRLVYFLESNNILTNLQSGFRKHCSTTDQLIRLETWIREGLANGEHVVAIFFDLEKAYDTAWKHGILSDLYTAGLRGNMPIFISNFLTDRTFHVRLGATLSNWYNQETGVPQGSILSVTLFGLKINKIVNCITPGTEASLYVDDFLACVRSKQMRSIERQLQLCLNKLYKWSNENGFKFSASKTVCIHFCNKRRAHSDPLLLLNGQPIPVVKETKFLGVIFDHKLSFIPHLKNLRTKCLKAMNLLKVVSHRDWGGDSTTLLMLYRSLIRSKLDYGCTVYGSARNSYLMMLDPVQTQALRLCLGAFRTSPAESMQVEANEPPLALRRNKLAIQYACRMKFNPANPAHKITFDPQYTTLFETNTKIIPTYGVRVKILVDQMKLNLLVIAEKSLVRPEPWTLRLPRVSFSLHLDKKSSINPTILKMYFNKYLFNNLDSFHIYTDGSKDPNGTASAAVSKNRRFICRLPSEASVFSAEAQAIILALDIIDLTNHPKFIIFSDSMSCLQAIHFHKFDNPIILQILVRSHMLLTSHKNIKFCWLPSHVGIKGNETADAAARAALQIPISADIKLPYTDLKQSINMHFKNIWQERWTMSIFNKLQTVKPILGETKLPINTCRRDEVVWHRARIGHTYLTHSYLLKRENHPDCIACKCPQTVQHILIYCPSYTYIRQKYFNTTSLQELFSKIQPKHIISFLKEANLYSNF